MELSFRSQDKYSSTLTEQTLYLQSNINVSYRDFIGRLIKVHAKNHKDNIFINNKIQLSRIKYYLK